MKIPTRILRALVAECDIYPPICTPRQLLDREIIRSTSLRLIAAHGPRGISFRQIMKEAGVGVQRMHRFYTDEHELLGDLIRCHFTALAQALQYTPAEAAQRRRAYFEFTHTALGTLTEAHLVATRDIAGLPEDERLPSEAARQAVEYLLGGDEPGETMRLLDTPHLDFDRMETLLAQGIRPAVLSARWHEAPPDPVAHGVVRLSEWKRTHKQ